MIRENREISKTQAERSHKSTFAITDSESPWFERLLICDLERIRWNDMLLRKNRGKLEE